METTDIIVTVLGASFLIIIGVYGAIDAVATPTYKPDKHTNQDRQELDESADDRITADFLAFTSSNQTKALLSPLQGAISNTAANTEVDIDAIEAALAKEAADFMGKRKQRTLGRSFLKKEAINGALSSFDALLIPVVPTHSHIEIVIIVSRKLEMLLEQKFKAHGKGLHSKLTSVEHLVPQHIIKSIRWIASVRNTTVHGEPALFDKQSYVQTANNVIQELNNN